MSYQTDATGLPGQLTELQWGAVVNDMLEIPEPSVLEIPQVAYLEIFESADVTSDFGRYVRDQFEIPEPGVFDIPVTGFLEIDESIGPNVGLSYVVRVHPAQDQALAENSSLYVLDYYDITESYALDIPASALMEIAETSGAQDFDIS